MNEEKVVLQAFAASLRTLRRRRGYSQERLALEGISRGHVSDMERGLRDPKLSMLIRIAELLDVAPTALMREIERNMERLTNRRKS